MNKTWKVICLTVAVLLLMVRVGRFLGKSEGNAQIISDKFERHWYYDNGDFTHVIKRKFAERGETEYESMYVKKSFSDRDEMIFACTNDGQTFHYFKYNRYRDSFDELEDNGIPKPKKIMTR